jgi:hypothetical protein
MTSTAEPTPTGVTQRWRSALNGLGGLADNIALAGQRRSRTISDTHDEYVHLGEVFVRADPARRRSLDLLCVALLDRRSEAYERDRRAEVVVLSTETVRSHITALPAGLLATDLLIGRGGPDLRSVSLVLFALERRPTVLDVVDSIESLGQVIDYENDLEGSAAVAEAIIRRVDSLASTPGVSVVVTAEVNRSGYMADNPHHLFVRPGSEMSEAGGLSVDDGRVVYGPEGSRVPWQERDFVLVSFGRARSRPAEVRSIRELRQEHALADVGLQPGAVTDEESWTARATRMRQAARAQQVVSRAVAGEPEVAWDLFCSAASESDPGGLVEALATRIRTSREYWLVDAALSVGAGDATTGDDDPAVRARTRLLGELERVLGLTAPTSDDPTYLLPITTPIVVEVGGRLAEIVQSKPDGRDVFEDVIPEMKARILDATGIALPGIRLRPNEAFAPGTFQLQIDEIPVLRGDVSLDAGYRVNPYTGNQHDGAGEITNLDPRTGKPGAWLLIPDDGETSVDDGGAATGHDALSTTAYLLHRIDVALRSQLARFLGPQEMDALLDRWRESDEEGLVAATAPDRRARLRLTWLLQSLAAESVSLVDARAILGAVNDVGGIEQPVLVLARQVRLALRDQLPGRREPWSRVTVPPELETAVLAESSSEYLPPLAVTQWLRRTVDMVGPVLCLVTTTPEARERIAVLGRLEHPFIATLSADELGATP